MYELGTIAEVGWRETEVGPLGVRVGDGRRSCGVENNLWKDFERKA